MALDIDILLNDTFISEIKAIFPSIYRPLANNRSCIESSSPTKHTILFLLCMEPVLHLSRGRFGYADDFLTLETAKTLGECSQKLQFESTKTELQYFHNTRKYTESPLLTENTLIQPNDSTRWLAIVFDRNLIFKEYARGACLRCRVVTDHVK